MPQAQQMPALLTVEEVAAGFRVSPSAIYRAIRAGEIRVIRLRTTPGSSIRVPVSEVERILADPPQPEEDT